MEIKIKSYRILIDKNELWRLRKYKYYPKDRGEGRMYFWRHVKENGKETTIMLHREILNCPKGRQVDHINGNTLDNRKENLRICTNAENRRNCKLSKNSTTGFKGVHWHSGMKKYQARIAVNGRRYSLGFYETAKEAYLEYCINAIKYHGKFARTA